LRLNLPALLLNLLALRLNPSPSPHSIALPPKKSAVACRDSVVLVRLSLFACHPTATLWRERFAT
jgi:hypothetical protein